jgi:hypothetical protein
MRDVGGGAEAVHTEAAAGPHGGQFQRAIPDDARTEQRRRLDVAEVGRDGVRVVLVHHRVLRVPPVGVPAGELGALAQVLAVGRAVDTPATRATQPRDADAIALAKARGVPATADHATDDLVAGHQR